MVAVLCPVAINDFPFVIVMLDGKGDTERMVAEFEDAQDAMDTVWLLSAFMSVQPFHQLVRHDAGALVEEVLHYLKEVGVVLPLNRSAVTVMADLCVSLSIQ